MPKPYPKGFRDDVVAVARRGQAPLTRIAKELGICVACLSNWVKKADIDDEGVVRHDFSASQPNQA